MAEMREEGSDVPWQVVVGLGNPGQKYRATRHNVGFRVLDELARRRGSSLDREECGARIAVLQAHHLLLVQPQTFMNRSGYALRCLAETRSLSAASFLVVYDEIHLPLGRLRLRPKGGPAGHRGMESVIENLRTEQVARMRCGVALDDGAPLDGEELVDFVLAPFGSDEEEKVEDMIRRAADACEAYLAEGVAAAMNRFNG